MKALYLYLSMLLAALGLSCNFRSASDNLSISVKNNDAGYNFEATYPERKTDKVVAYLEKALQDDQLFTASSDIKNVNVVLSDSTAFYLKAEPGFIVIDFKKQMNSFTSYKKMEEVCLGLKELLAD
ncbi:hypothetical protein [Pedobacter sp. Hv1]|uniref:hypothetical protein n=1 Tax=Pedobacter sp. Hv1 TaxID=1740090 RepID=UPI00128F6B98|nr:hypothetical protein [Pedobacter sp. Hv1]